MFIVFLFVYSRLEMYLKIEVFKYTTNTDLTASLSLGKLSLLSYHYQE